MDLFKYYFYINLFYSFPSFRDNYFFSISWISQTQVSVIWLNRPQNLSITTICKSPVWKCMETHRVIANDRGWVDATSTPVFSSNTSSYIAIKPLREGGYGYYRHLVHVNIASKTDIPLTHGKFEVRKIVNWDEINHWM